MSFYDHALEIQRDYDRMLPFLHAPVIIFAKLRDRTRKRRLQSPLK